MAKARVEIEEDVDYDPDEKMFTIEIYYKGKARTSEVHQALSAFHKELDSLTSVDVSVSRLDMKGEVT